MKQPNICFCQILVFLFSSGQGYISKSITGQSRAITGTGKLIRFSNIAGTGNDDIQLVVENNSEKNNIFAEINKNNDDLRQRNRQVLSERFHLKNSKGAMESLKKQKPFSWEEMRTQYLRNKK